MSDGLNNQNKRSRTRLGVPEAIIRHLLVKDVTDIYLQIAHQRLDGFLWRHVRELEETWMQSVLQADAATKSDMKDLAEWIIGRTIVTIDHRTREDAASLAFVEKFHYSTLALDYTVRVLGGHLVVASALRLDPTAALHYNRQ